MRSNDLNSKLFFHLKTEIQKQNLFINKDLIKQFPNGEDVLKNIFHQIISITNNSTLIKRRKIFVNIILCNFSQLLYKIISHKKLSPNLSNEILYFFRNILIDNNSLLNDSTQFIILSLYYNYIQFCSNLNKYVFSLHNDFIYQLKDNNQTQRNSKLVFKILISIYRNYSLSKYTNGTLLSQIIEQLLSFLTQALNNKKKDNILLFYLSSIKSLCNEKHSPQIINILSKSESFYMLSGNILSSQHIFNYQILSSLLNIYSFVLNNETKVEMIKILYSPNYSYIKKKFDYHFPFIRNFTKEKINFFCNTCFYILRLLIQDDKSFSFFTSSLKSFSTIALLMNKYFEAIFFEFFYWNKKHKENYIHPHYSELKLSFIKTQLLKFKTRLELHDKQTIKAILNFLDMEDKNELLSLENVISNTNKIKVNIDQMNFPLVIFTKIIALYPNNKFVISVLNEIPIEFILNRNGDNKNEIFIQRVDGVLCNIKNYLERIVNEIDNVEESQNEYTKLFYQYLDMLKVYLILHPLSLNKNIDIQNKSSENIKEKNDLDLFKEKIINIINTVFEYFSSIFFSNVKFIYCSQTCKKIFWFVVFIIQNLPSFINNIVFNDGEIIIQYINYINSNIKQPKGNKQYEIIRLFFLELLAPIKIKLFQNAINHKLIASLLILMENVFQYQHIKLDLFLEILVILRLINEHTNNEAIKELLINFYMNSNNFISIIKIIINNKMFIYYQGNNDYFFYIINAFLDFFTNSFLNNIMNYFQIQEEEFLIIQLLILIENYIYNSNISILNQRTFYLFIELLKKIIKHSRIIQWNNKNILISNFIYSTFHILEKIIPYNSFQKSNNNKIIKKLLSIISSLFEIYMSDTSFNFQDKEIFLINSNILSIINNFLPNNLSILKGKIINNIIDIIIPCPKIEDDDISNINSFKSQFLLTLWNKPEYKNILYKLLLNALNSRNIHSLSISNTINILLGNIGFMITNAKKQYQLFELISFNHKWLVSSFFKNIIFYLVDSSVKSTILITNIIKVLESKIQVVGIEQNDNTRISRAFRIQTLKQHNKCLTSFSKVLLKEDKTQINFIPQMISNYYKINYIEEKFEYIDNEEEKLKEIFNTQKKISKKQKLSLTLSMKSIFENFKEKKENNNEEKLNIINDKLSVDEEKVLEKPKQFFMYICDKITKIKNHIKPNPYEIKLINMDLTKIFTYHKFYKLIQNEDIYKNILYLLNLPTNICFIHTKLGIFLIIKQLINELILNKNYFSFMESFFISNFKQLLIITHLEDNISKIKYDVITLYISYISNDELFIKNNISLFDLHPLLTLLKRMKFNIDIISNLLDIIEHTIIYLINNNNIQNILNNSNELKEKLLIELLSSYPLIIKIQKRVLNIYKAISSSDKTISFIQSIIDPFLSNILKQLMIFCIDGTITNCDNLHINTNDEICTYLINTIFYYCSNFHYFQILILSKENLFFSQLLQFIKHYSSNMTIIEIGFFILEKTITQINSITHKYANEIQSLLFTLLEQSVYNKCIIDNLVLQILTMINYLFVNHKEIVKDYYNNSSFMIILQNIIDDFQDNIDITFMYLNIIKVIIENYLLQKEIYCEDIEMFIEKQLVTVILKEKFERFIFKTCIIRQISNIIHVLIKNEKYLDLHEEIFQMFLIENFSNIYQSDLPNELIDILLSNIFIFCSKHSFLINNIESLSNLINVINQNEKYFNHETYKHFYSYIKIIMIAITLWDNENKKSILEQTLQNLLFSIIIKYNKYLSYENLYSTILLLEEEVKLELTNEISFPYINNILSTLLPKTQSNPLSNKQNNYSLYQNIFQSLSYISNSIYDNDVHNINELIMTFNKVFTFLSNYFQLENISDGDKMIILTLINKSIMQIGLNNPSFVICYHNKNSELQKSELNEITIHITNIIQQLYMNSENYIILSKHDKDNICKKLSQQQKFYYFDKKGKKQNVVLKFEFPEDYKDKVELKILKVHKKTSVIIKEYFHCSIEKIEKIVKGKQSEEFIHYENKILGRKKRNPSNCFVIHLNQHDEKLNKANTISLEMRKDATENEINIYIHNINILINSMKPLSTGQTKLSNNND